MSNDESEKTSQAVNAISGLTSIRGAISGLIEQLDSELKRLEADATGYQNVAVAKTRLEQSLLALSEGLYSLQPETPALKTEL